MDQSHTDLSVSGSLRCVLYPVFRFRGLFSVWVYLFRARLKASAKVGAAVMCPGQLCVLRKGTTTSNLCVKPRELATETTMPPSVSQIDLLEGHAGHTGHTPSQQPVAGNAQTTYLIPDFKALESIFQHKQKIETLRIPGFEIYIVEQWATDRTYSNLITSYTGDSEHQIKVGKITLPADTSQWDKKVVAYFEELKDSGAKLKATERGPLFITNLSDFPSNLNLLPIVTGYVLDVWDFFKVNLNLRKLHCGGRSALLLSSPSDASEDKFRQIYKVHPKVDIVYAVKELVTLVQICLVDFKLLDPSFVDGLFCNKTEAKILEWWALYGSMYFGIAKPSDGVLGSTTVSAILGFVLSCNFRLDVAGSDLPKEPFNYFNFRVNVGKFQRQYNLVRTWYLDPITVEKLFRVTSKTSDISKLKKAVKYTVHDISGRISSEQSSLEVLTLDLDKSLKYFTCSPRLAYLWYGKGNVADIMAFQYHESRPPSNYISTSTLKSGVGKIRNLPKKLQADNYSYTSKRREEELDSFLHPATTGAELCQQVIDSVKVNPCDEAVAGDVTCDKRGKILDVESFMSHKNRRMSYPYLLSEIGAGQLSYGNHHVELTTQSRKTHQMKRSKSFSFVEAAVLKFATEPSSLSLARTMKKLQLKQIDAQKSISSPSSTIKGVKIKMQESGKELTKLSHQLAPLLHHCDQQIQEQERLQLKMSDIEAIGARLEYEIRVLSTKVRDTEDSVNDFVRKVNDLELSVDDQMESLKAYTTFDGDYWCKKFQQGQFWKHLNRLEDYSIVRWMKGVLYNKQEKTVESDEYESDTVVVNEKMKSL